MTPIRVLDDFVPVVEIVRQDGVVVQMAAADLSDDGAEQLAGTFRHGLVGVVVRVVRIPRVEVLCVPRVPLRA